MSATSSAVATKEVSDSELMQAWIGLFCLISGLAGMVLSTAAFIIGIWPDGRGVLVAVFASGVVLFGSGVSQSSRTVAGRSVNQLLQTVAIWVWFLSAVTCVASFFAATVIGIINLGISTPVQLNHLLLWVLGISFGVVLAGLIGIVVAAVITDD